MPAKTNVIFLLKHSLSFVDKYFQCIPQHDTAVKDIKFNFCFQIMRQNNLEIKLQC